MVLCGLPGLCDFSSVVVLRKVFWSWFLGVTGFTLFYSGVCFGEFLHVVPVFGPVWRFRLFVTKLSLVMCVCLIFCGRRVTFYVVFLGLLRPASFSLLRVCAVLCMSVASTGCVTIYIYIYIYI